eukprot:710163_1
MCLICLLLVSLRRTINSALFIAEGGNEACHNCILEDNEVKCWGMNIFGECGYGDTNNRGDEANEMGDTLLEIDLGSNFTAMQIIGGWRYTCALSTENKVKCWGYNQYGLGYEDSEARGDGPNEMGDSLLEIDLGSNFTPMEIVGGWVHVCALSTTNTIKCFGYNEHGQLGLGDTNNRGGRANEMGDNLLDIDLGSDFIPMQIMVGHEHTCALSTRNKMKCFGRNNYGQLGYEDTNDRGDEANQMGDNLSEIDLGSDFIPMQIALGSDHTCALSTSNAVKCFGYNMFGQLGYGDQWGRGVWYDEMGDNLTVIELGTNFVPLQITAGMTHTCILSTTFEVKCFGSNGHGEIAADDYNNRGDWPDQMGNNLPVIDLGTSFIPTQIVAGYWHNCALSTAYTVKCW